MLPTCGGIFTGRGGEVNIGVLCGQIQRPFWPPRKLRPREGAGEASVQGRRTRSGAGICLRDRQAEGSSRQRHHTETVTLAGTFVPHTGVLPEALVNPEVLEGTEGTEGQLRGSGKPAGGGGWETAGSA